MRNSPKTFIKLHGNLSEMKAQRVSATNWPKKITDQESFFTTHRLLLRKERAFQCYIICGVTLKVKQKSFLKFWLPAYFILGKKTLEKTNL